MECDDLFFYVSGKLHILSLIIAVFGTYKQIDSIQNDEPHSIWLSLTLAIMLLLRIPNQVCVSFREFDGWYTVIGTLMGVIGFSYLTYITYSKNVSDKKKDKKDKKDKKR